MFRLLQPLPSRRSQQHDLRKIFNEARDKAILLAEENYAIIRATLENGNLSFSMVCIEKDKKIAEWKTERLRENRDNLTDFYCQRYDKKLIKRLEEQK